MMAYLFMAASILLTGVGQVLLKIGAVKKGLWHYQYTNPAAITGYVILLIVTVCSVLALQEIQLKQFYAIASLNYLVVAVLSAVVLKDKITLQKGVALVLIVVGILVFNF